MENKYRYIVCGVVQKDDQIALGKKAKGQAPYPDFWHTPGGGVEDQDRAKILFDCRDFDNSYFHEELQREIGEELGIAITDIHCIVPKYRSEPRQGETVDKTGNRTHYFFLEYLCHYVGGELKPGDDLAQVQWVKKSDLQNIPLTPPSKDLYTELRWM